MQIQASGQVPMQPCYNLPANYKVLANGKIFGPPRPYFDTILIYLFFFFFFKFMFDCSYNGTIQVRTSVTSYPMIRRDNLFLILQQFCT